MVVCFIFHHIVIIITHSMVCVQSIRHKPRSYVAARVVISPVCVCVCVR